MYKCEYDDNADYYEDYYNPYFEEMYDENFSLNLQHSNARDFVYENPMTLNGVDRSYKNHKFIDGIY